MKQSKRILFFTLTVAGFALLECVLTALLSPHVADSLFLSRTFPYLARLLAVIPPFLALGAAVEAMSYYGREIMLPAYYDITLQGKIARDDESAGVLDLIFDTAMLDLGTLYNFGGMRDIFTNMVETKTNTFTSTYASIEQNVNTAIDKLIETVSALD